MSNDPLKQLLNKRKSIYKKSRVKKTEIHRLSRPLRMALDTRVVNHFLYRILQRCIDIHNKFSSAVYAVRDRRIGK